MKKKRLIYAALPLAVLILLGAGGALAHGWFPGFGANLSPEEIASHQQAVFQQQAQILGIGLDEVKEAWAEGKTMKQIMEEEGINQEQVRLRIQELRMSQLKSHLQALIDQGVITQTQADKRLETMQNLFQNKTAKGMKGGMMGWGMEPRF